MRYKLAFLLIAWPLCATAQAPYMIDTYAGQLKPDGVAATSSFLTLPQGIAVDGKNLYIGETGGNRVRRVTLNKNIISTVAGNGVPGFSGDGGPAVNAQLDAPRYPAVDSHGNLFISEWNNHRIRRVDKSSGTITTVAGTGVRGYNEDGIPATQAQLNLPRGIAVDSNGDLYIADQFNCRIRRVDALTQMITTVVGTGTCGYSENGTPAATANISGLIGVILDSQHRLFFIANQRVRRVEADGKIYTVAGTGGVDYNGDNIPATTANIRPRGIAFDAAGNLFIADRPNERIRRVDASTQLITTVAGNGDSCTGASNGTAAGTSLCQIEGVGVDSQGNIYISEWGANKVRRVDTNGNITTIAGSSGPDNAPATSAFLNSPSKSAVDRYGNLYICDALSNRIRRVAAATGTITTIAGNGFPGYSGDGGLAVTAQLFYPQGVALDGAGNLYIADSSNYVIRKVAAGTTIITTVAGTGNVGYNGDNIPATSANLDLPEAVAVDSFGNLFIAEEHRIRRVDASTQLITTVAGTGDFGFNGDGIQATQAQLYYPYDVAVDGAGNVFIADAGNNRIRKVSASDGKITTVAGNGIAGYGGDGGPATAAQLNGPVGLWLSSTGDLFFADNGNQVIRRVDAHNGKIVTIAGNGTAGYGGDGGPATAAQLSFPTGVAGDSSGRLYIPDLSNRVRRLTPSRPHK